MSLEKHNVELEPSDYRIVKSDNKIKLCIEDVDAQLIECKIIKFCPICGEKL